MPWWFIGLSSDRDNPLEGWLTSRLEHLEKVLATREWLAAGRFTAGLFLWITAFAAPGERVHAATGAAALLLTSIHMTLLGALLSLSPRPLYGLDEVTCFGTVLDAGQDQQLGGIIMLIVGAVVYLAGGVALVARLVAEPLPADATADRSPTRRYCEMLHLDVSESGDPYEFVDQQLAKHGRTRRIAMTVPKSCLRWR